MTEVTKAFSKLKEIFTDHGEILNQLNSIRIEEYEFESDCVLQTDMNRINEGDLYYHEMIGRNWISS